MVLSEAAHPADSDWSNALTTLEALGFRSFFSQQFDNLSRPELVPARIVAVGQSAWHLAGCRAPDGPPPGTGATPPAPPGVDQDQWDQAMQACQSLAPQPPGGLGGPPR